MNCETLQEYLDRYGPLVADRARQAFEPLHVPATDAVVTLDLKRPMLPPRPTSSRRPSRPCSGRRPCSCAASAARARRQMGACTVHAHADGKPYRAIVMCPPHLVETWRAELRAGLPRTARSKSTSWRSGRELLRCPREKPTEADLAHHGRDPGEERPLLAACRREGQPAACSAAPTAASQLRGKASGEGNFLTHEGPGAVAEAVYGRSADSPTSTPMATRHAALRCGLVAVHRQARDLGTGRLHPQAHAGRVRLPDLRRGPRGEIGDFGPCQRLGRPGGLVPQGDRHDRHPDRRQGRPRPLAAVPVVAQEPQGREPVVGRRHGVCPPLRAGGHDRHREDRRGATTTAAATARARPSGRPNSRASCPRCTAGT